MDVEINLKHILNLVFNQDTSYFNDMTPLSEVYAEFDSMSIMNLLLELEHSFSVNMNSIELSRESFETFGALLRCVKNSIYSANCNA